MQKIASALKIRPSELIFAESPKDAADLHVKIITDFELMESIREYYLLSEENQRMVRDLIRSLKKSED